MKRSKRLIDRYFWHGLVAVVFIGGLANAVIWFWPRSQTQVFGPPSYSVERVARGETLYQANRASCHGEDLAGYGRASLAAPALDASEHAWHHADSQMTSWIREGLGKMHAIGPSWNDEDIDAAPSFIKQSWEPDQLLRQTENSRLNP